VPKKSAAVESVIEFASTIVDAVTSGFSRYRRIFGEERWARASDLLVFIIIHVFVFVPLAVALLKVERPSGFLVFLLGIVWALIGYPACYIHENRSGLLRLSVYDYLVTRALALLFSWALSIILPIFVVYSLRWIIFLILIFAVIMAFLK
jgi:hypothetical protein